MNTTEKGLPRGAWPVLLTPFTADRQIDWDGVDILVDWYIEQGVAGLFTNSMSSEVFFLHPWEREQLARRVVDKAAGRVPVISSAIAGGSTAQWAAEITRVQDTGVDAVVLITSLLAGQNEPDAVWQERLNAILDAVPTGDLGLYECPTPYKRLLDTPLIAKAAKTGRFVYFKDTCQSPRQMAERIAAMAGTRMAFYNAEIQSLVESDRAGGDGFSGLAANIHPRQVQWLVENDRSDDPRVDDVQLLLSIAEHGIGWNYPTSAKFLLEDRYGLPISHFSRMNPQTFTAHQSDPVAHMADYLERAGFADLPVAAFALQGASA